MSKIKLNEQQQQAVDKIDGAVSVLANPGSGKSLVLLDRIEKMVREHKIQEREILAITFTRDVANHMIKQLADKNLHFVNVGTFHSICGQILREEGISINPSNMIQEWQIDNCFKEIDKKADVKDIVSWISYQKNYMIGVDDKFVEKSSAYSNDELRVFYRAYEDMKKRYSKYDFDDYLLLCYNMLKKNPSKHTYGYILVDEHQDSNTVQNKLLELWVENNNIFAVSDPKQAIYSFRGGTTEYSMNFDRYWSNAKTITIDTNYRSAKNIIERSNNFIKKYYGEFEHYADSIPFKQENGHIQVDSRINREVEAVEVVDEIEKLIGKGTELKDITVLYRNNKHADFVENELKRREIEYDIANDSSFFKRREIAGILSFLRLIQDTEDNNAFEGAFRLRTHPLKYFSNQIFNNIQEHANMEGISLYDTMQEIEYPQTWHMSNVVAFRRSVNRLQDMFEDGESVITLINEIIKLFKIRELVKEKYSHIPEREERMNSLEVLKSFVKGNNLEQFITYVYSNTEKKKKKENAVQLMTIHRSKGLEFDNVFLIGVEDGEFPSQRDGAMNDIVEEARLFYVATTRSKKNLWISEIGKGNRFVVEYGYE